MFSRKASLHNLCVYKVEEEKSNRSDFWFCYFSHMIETSNLCNLIKGITQGEIISEADLFVNIWRPKNSCQSEQSSFSLRTNQINLKTLR